MGGLIFLFEALYAIFQVFSDTPMVWWWKSRFGGGGRASGTFIGSNHFAGYMEMLIPLIFGFMPAQKTSFGRDGWMIRTNPLEKSPQEWPSDSTRQAKLKVQSKEKAQMDERILFREDGIRKFQELFRRSLEINPRRWKEAEERVREYFPDVT